MAYSRAHRQSESRLAEFIMPIISNNQKPPTVSQHKTDTKSREVDLGFCARLSTFHGNHT